MMMQYNFFSALPPRLLWKFETGHILYNCAIIDATSNQESPNDDDVADQDYLPNKFLNVIS